MEEKEIQATIDAVCNVGPYDFDFAQSTPHLQVYHCRACGAEVRRGTTVTNPSWAHQKPWVRDEPKRSTETAIPSIPIQANPSLPEGIMVFQQPDTGAVTAFSLASITQSYNSFVPGPIIPGPMPDGAFRRPPLYRLDPKTNEVTPVLDEDRVRALIAEAIEAAEDRLVERVFNKLVVRLRTRTLP